MPTVTPLAAYAATIEVGDAAKATAASWTEIASVKEIPEFGAENEYADVTAHDSTGGWREFFPTLRENVPFDLRLIFSEANATQAKTGDGILNLADGRTLRGWRITSADGTTIYTFDAYIQVKYNFPLTEEEQLVVSFRPTGSADLTVS